MKTTLVLLFIALLTFSLAGCGGGTEKDVSAQPSAMAGAPAEESGVPAAQQGDGQSLGDEMNGSLADGAQGKIEAGDTTLEYGGDWPDYALLRNIPKPSAGTVAATEEVAGSMASVMLVDMSMDECRDYAKLLSGAGFDQNIVETDMEGLYSYSADNGGGLHIDCGYVSEAVMVQVSVMEE